jgi:phage tail sheath gpL-like
MNKLLLSILFVYNLATAVSCQSSDEQVLHFIISNSQDHQSLDYLTDLYNYEANPTNCKYNIIWSLQNGKLKVVDTISSIKKEIPILSIRYVQAIPLWLS